MSQTQPFFVPRENSLICMGFSCFDFLDLPLLYHKNISMQGPISIISKKGVFSILARLSLRRAALGEGDLGGGLNGFLGGEACPTESGDKEFGGQASGHPWINGYRSFREYGDEIRIRLRHVGLTGAVPSPRHECPDCKADLVATCRPAPSIPTECGPPYDPFCLRA